MCHVIEIHFTCLVSKLRDYELNITQQLLTLFQTLFYDIYNTNNDPSNDLDT